MFLKNHINYIVYLMAASVAIGCVALGNYLHAEYLLSQVRLAGLWLKICYPAFILLSFIVSLICPISPWIWSFVLVASTYIGMAHVFGTQAPPFEILLMLALAVPYIIASYVGLFIKRRYG